LGSKGHYRGNEDAEESHSTYSDEGESDEYDIDDADIYTYHDDRRDDEPYCPRCDRHFGTISGFLVHCRMSSMHHWWCDDCDTDFDRG
jgi:hypothetical protein